MVLETVQGGTKHNQISSQMESDLQEFITYLNSSFDPERLSRQKELIKESIKDPQHWQKRILSYKKVRLINERLAKISN